VLKDVKNLEQHLKRRRIRKYHVEGQVWKAKDADSGKRPKNEQFEVGRKTIMHNERHDQMQRIQSEVQNEMKSKERKTALVCGEKDWRKD
jgi:uncharacterized protein (UPF0262 family)